MKLFFKKIGIMLVPCILTILAIIAFDVLFDMSWNADYPAKDPLQPIAEIVYRGSIHAISRVLFGTVIAVWVFCSLMNWAKGKIVKMLASDMFGDSSEQEQGKSGNPGEQVQGKGSNQEPAQRGVQVRITSFAFSITTNIQKWLNTTRHLSSAISDGIVVGNVHLDISNEDDRKNNDFWKKCDAFIYALWVDGAYRKHHIATQLLNTAEQEAKEAGCKTVALGWNAKESDEWVLRWYLHRGYEEKEFDNGVSFLVKTLD